VWDASTQNTKSISTSCEDDYLRSVTQQQINDGVTGERLRVATLSIRPGAVANFVGVVGFAPPGTNAAAAGVCRGQTEPTTARADR
jgi:hypothetical protein